MFQDDLALKEIEDAERSLAAKVMCTNPQFWLTNFNSCFCVQDPLDVGDANSSDLSDLEDEVESEILAQMRYFE